MLQSRPDPAAGRTAAAAALLARLCLLAALTATTAVTWAALADHPPGSYAGLPPPLVRAALLLAAPAAVAAVAFLLARHPPPGVPYPGAVGALGASAVLISAELRAPPAEAVLGLCAIALTLTDLLARPRPHPAGSAHVGAALAARTAGEAAPAHGHAAHGHAAHGHAAHGHAAHGHAAPPAADARPAARRRWRPPVGPALGVAVALHPALALFAAPLWLRGARRPALTALATAAVLRALAWAVHPGAPAHPATADLGNQSAAGTLLRLGVPAGAPLTAAALLIAAPVAVLALRRAGRLTTDGQPLAALGVAGSAVVVAGPVTGPVQLGWLLLAATARLGRRPEDRALWPVVALTVALLPSTMLDPGVEPVTGFLLRNAPVLVAAAAAAALPFLRRGDPRWQLHRAAVPARRHPFGLPYLPLLPARLRPLSRPNLLLELLFIQVGYGIYTWIRNAVPERTAAAVEHALTVRRLEQTLRLDVEQAVNAWTLGASWLLDAAQDYYKIAHFAIVLAVLVWLYARRPTRYRTGRTVLFAATGLALLGFWGYPLAPPRLTPGSGVHDTLYGVPAADPLGALTALTNQYAAMPSLHIAWAGWCTLMVLTTVRRRWVRAAAVLYPVLTLYVVVGTANHWLLDAVGGVAVLVAGCGVEYLLTGRLPADRATFGGLAELEEPPAVGGGVAGR